MLRFITPDFKDHRVDKPYQNQQHCLHLKPHNLKTYSNITCVIFKLCRVFKTIFVLRVISLQKENIAGQCQEGIKQYDHRLAL